MRVRIRVTMRVRWRAWVRVWVMIKGDGEGLDEIEGEGLDRG